VSPNEIAVRERFIAEVDQPFNVTAPAGSGKTYAIVRRVENLIRYTQNKIALVTYTNKAAEEMKARLEALLKDTIYDPQRLFVGTIHSLCTELISKYASSWGVVTPIEIIPSLDRLLDQYFLETPNVFSKLPQEVSERFCKHFEIFKSELLDQVDPTFVDAKKFCAPPTLNLAPILQIKLTKSTSMDLRRMRRWAERFIEEGGWDSVVSVIKRPTTKKAAEIYDEVFGGYEKWRSQQAYYYARYLAYDFRQYRNSQSKFSYEDLINKVYENLNEAEDYAVVLDEAQDTSDKQLEILQRLAARRSGKLDFTLVGDPQQSIYGSRASLSFYQKKIDELCQNSGLENITFETTFRCDKAIVDWVNAIGSTLLDGKQTQANYVNLSLRDDAKTGSIGRWVIDGDFEELKGDLCHQAEADFIAKKLSGMDYRAAEKIAILSPRNSYLQTIAQSLKKAGIPFQIHSESKTMGAPQRLLKSVASFMARPYDSFEIIGFLREAFAVSDAVISRAYRNSPDDFNLANTQEIRADDPNLSEALILLRRAWVESTQQPIAMALRYFCECIDLRGRLSALEGIVGENLLEEYDRVLAAMIVGSDSVRSLDELVDLAIVSSSDIKPGHIQLLTMHKAKGLEWDLVILPYMARPISQKPIYPTLQKSGDEFFLAYNKEQIDTVAQQRSIAQENSRLLYVAYTRARSHLILIDDQSLYAPKTQRSPIDLCKISSIHKDLWSSLPSDLKIPELKSKPLEVIEVRGNPWQLNVKTGSERITPSSQAVEHTQYQKMTQGGSLYGSDWHDAWAGLAEGMSSIEIQEFLLSKARDFEKSDRGEKEFKALFSTELSQKLLNLPFWTEVPLLVEMPEGVIEGRLDVVAKKDDGLWIVDWKTDHLDPEEIWQTYKEQLASYKKGMELLEGSSVAASLYSTVHGVWIEDDGNGGCTLIT